MALTFEEFIDKLQRFWVSQGCLRWFPHHDMVGAGTNNPATILRMLGPEPHRIVYVEPSFRPDDGRYAENPNRVQMHHQLQVVLKPLPHNIQDLYLHSLEEVGISSLHNDIRFVEDNWAAPVIGAWGLGWEVWLNGMEVSQYTYFQQAGGIALSPPAVELTYGLERLAMYMQGVNSLWDLQWNDQFTYGDLLKKQEIEYCIYNFEKASIERTQRLFSEFEQEAHHAIDNNLPMPAYDFICRCSHAFNILDARGAVGVGERAQFFGRMRGLTRRVADAYIATRKSLNFPLVGSMPQDFLPNRSSSQETVDTNNLASFGLYCAEIGFEELPVDACEALREFFDLKLRPALTQERLSFDHCDVTVTPRRLSITMRNLSAFQEPLSQEIKGPARSICEKNPAALQGFAKKNKSEVSDIFFKTHHDGEYATVRVTGESESIVTIIPSLIVATLSEFSFGKAMRWLPDSSTTSKVTFNRPIRWILSLFESTIIPFSYAGLHATRETRGPRWKKSPIFSVASAQEYLQRMEAENIILDPQKRRALLVSSLSDLARKQNATFDESHGLIDEINYLVECPSVFLGELPAIAQSLPAIVIKKVIEKHVRCFSLFSSTDGSAFPLFIGVANGVFEDLSVIKKGFERVIGARLTDAHFFIEKDKKSLLDSFIPQLDKIIIHERLGSQGDKVKRLISLMPVAKECFDLSEEESKILEHSIGLAKADLGTSMVQEMTSLQGEMGALYAADQKEPPSVVEIIREHYLPRVAGDKVPESQLARILGILNRLDTLTGFFGIGLEPSGSADPFGLRREAVGLLSLLAATPTANVATVLSKVLSSYKGVRFHGDDKHLLESIESFLLKRLEVQLREEGYETSLVRAVIAIHKLDVFNVRPTLQKFRDLLFLPSFHEIIPSYLRSLRLYKTALSQNEPIDSGHTSALLTESDLKIVGILANLPVTHSIDKAVQFLTSFSKTIDEFFDTTMIMAPDSQVRAQRLGVLERISRLFLPFADLTLLAFSEQAK